MKSSLDPRFLEIWNFWRSNAIKVIIETVLGAIILHKPAYVESPETHVFDIVPKV